MVMQREETPDQQQKADFRCIPCFDVLIAFLKTWFPKTAVLHSPIIQLKRYTGSSAQYQELINWKVSDDAKEGRLKSLGIVCDNYTPLVLYIKVGDKELKDAVIQTPYNLPFDDLVLRRTQEQSSNVIVKAKSDGTTEIAVDASLVGYEVF